MEHLELDLMTPRGFVRASGPPARAQYPLALTDDGRPVYGIASQAVRQSSLTSRGMMLYDDEVERQRRLLADSALGQIMIERPRHSEKAITRVSQDIRTWWARKSPTLTRSQLAGPVSGAQNYLYGAASFGRMRGSMPQMEELEHEGTEVTDLLMLKHLVGLWLAALSGPFLPQIMSLQDYFGRVFKALGPNDNGDVKKSAENRRYEEMLRKVRHKWYEDPGLRGRTNLGDHQKAMTVKRPGYKAVPVKMSGMPGLITVDFTIPVGDSLDRCGLELSTLHLQERNRGIDMFLTNATTMEENFKRSLGAHNLNFSASASGTTATLFGSAAAFSDLENWKMEDKKEYVLGCMAYLVGGGMHTCHEVFWTARNLGLPYEDGKYLAMLPQTFKQTTDYRKWTAEYWDIVREDRAQPRG